MAAKLGDEKSEPRPQTIVAALIRAKSIKTLKYSYFIKVLQTFLFSNEAKFTHNYFPPFPPYH